jgi:hypothetical protein
MFGPMGPMMNAGGQIWEWMWQLYLIGGIMQAFILLALLAGLGLALRDRRAAQPTGG